MSKLLLEKKCKVFAGRNFLFKFTASALSGGKIRFFLDHIEFDLLTTKRELKYENISYIKVKGNYLRFFHSSNTSKYLAILCLPEDKEEIVKKIKSLKFIIEE